MMQLVASQPTPRLAPRGSSTAGGAAPRPALPARRASGPAGRGAAGRPQCRPPRPVAAKSAEAPADSTAAAAADASVATVRRAAAEPGSVRPSELLAAVLDLEKRRLQPDSWLDTLSAPGKRWNLVYTVPAKDVVAAQKKKAGGGSGAYFPLTAAQKFDATDATFENGVFLSSLASLTFKGPYSMKDRRMAFDVTTMYLALGPWRFPITLKRDAPRLEQRPPADVVKLPFFLYAYVDSSCVVARGRSGGLAVWRSVDTEWQAKSGVLQVYK